MFLFSQAAFKISSWVHWLSWICGLIVFINLKFSDHYLFRYFFCSPYLPARDSNFTFIKLLKIVSLPTELFSYFQILFSLCFILDSFCYSVFNFHNFFSSAVSNFPLFPSNIFFISHIQVFIPTSSIWAFSNTF